MPFTQIFLHSQLSKGGMKQVEIAEILGVTKGTISKWLALRSVALKKFPEA